MTMVVMGDTCVQSITAIHTTMFLRLFVVAMAMVVIGDTCVQTIEACHSCVQSITAICTTMLVRHGHTHCSKATTTAC